MIIGSVCTFTLNTTLPTLWVFDWFSSIDLLGSLGFGVCFNCATFVDISYCLITTLQIMIFPYK